MSTTTLANDHTIGARLMRARPVALVGLLTLAGGVFVVPADAASANVRLSVVSRAGESYEISGGAINLATGRTYALSPGSAAALPAGRYSVGAYIYEQSVMTVAARTLAIGKSTTVTFDARKGRKVSFDVGDPSVQPVDLAVVPFARVNGKDKAFIPSNTQDWPPRATYVLPDSAAGVRLGIHGVLAKPGDASPVRYDLVHSLAGMPSNVAFSTTRAKLARVDLNVATVDSDQSSILELTARQKSLAPVTGVRVGAPVLGRQVSYRTPGLQWGTALSFNSLKTSAFLEEDQKANKLIYVAGKRYREEWGLGVWAPRPTSPAIFTQGGQLRVVGGPPICAFPGAGVKSSCQLQPQSHTYTLSKGKKSLGKGQAITAAIDASLAQWYTATLTATRDDAGELATKVTAKWYFQAGGKTRRETATAIYIKENQVAPGYIRILPGGADARNRVAPEARTPVAMTVQMFGKVASMTLQYSTDGGKSWTATKVARKGASWVGAVPAPASGTVSLKALAKSTTGATVEQTVVNAYGVR